MAPDPRPPAERIALSARSRIVLSIALFVAIAGVVSTFVLSEALERREAERVDARLIHTTQELRRLARAGRDPRDDKPFGDDLRALFATYVDTNVPGTGDVVLTFVGGRPYRTTPGGAAAAAMARRVSAVASARTTTWTEIEDDDRGFRVLAVPVTTGAASGTVVAVADVTTVREDVAATVRIAAAGWAIGLVLATLLGYVVAGRALQPLRDMTETARSLTGSDLVRRITVTGNDEIAELGRTFNAMLDRIEEAFTSQREFLSDAGHEMRTPITIVRGHLELLGDDPAERRVTLALVDDELTRMSRLVDDLLLLARAQRPDFLRLTDVDVDVLTDELVAKVRQLGDRDWQLERRGIGQIRADPQRLTQALLNLALNAAQHTDEGDTILVGSSLGPTTASFWVTDSGPGVPLADRKEIFDRFVGQRSARESTSTGLGLAITRVIAESHGGHVTVEDRTDGASGACFRMTIPTIPITPRGAASDDAHPHRRGRAPARGIPG